MIYWDTSALIPLLLRSEEASLIVPLLAESKIHCTSHFTQFEVQGVLRRLTLQKALSGPDLDQAQAQWADLRIQINFHSLDEQVTLNGLRTQRLYGLKPYDSVQLGTAIALQAEERAITFATLDRQLSRIAKQEGFLVL